MFSFFRKAPARRVEIRRNRPDTVGRRVERLRATGIPASLGIAAVFWLVATAILLLREEVIPYRPGQYAPHDILSRVDFTFRDKDQMARAQQTAREGTPRVYKAQNVWTTLEQRLLAIPNRVAAVASMDELAEDLQNILDSGSFLRLKELSAEKARPNYIRMVQGYVSAVRRVDPSKPQSGLFILAAAEREIDLHRGVVTLASLDGAPAFTIQTELTFSPEMRSDIEKRLDRHARENFELALQPKIVAFTLQHLVPSHVLDETATAAALNAAAQAVPASEGEIAKKATQKIVPRGVIEDRHYQLFRAENEAFLRHLDQSAWKSRIGLGIAVLIITLILATYIAKFQSRVVHKHPRGIAIAALLLSMLLVAQLSAIGSTPLYVFGIAPTILVAMILTIAYDQRFAIGVATLHAILVTIGTGGGLFFFLVLLAGVLTCCFLLDDIRTRSKLIEVGGASALAMIAATGAAGLIALDPIQYIGRNCLYTGAAGLAVGFVVLGILPFIEKTFRITTSMTLLELGDVSHPLLKRLSLEAPGTYNHSLQVATISEAASDAIGANSLLARVASYYHDVGKINKADYFIENQQDGENRHLNLSPSVSLLIIIGHVKDGIELAREYNLPTSIFPFIQQHHGTTLVEYFYHRACNQCPPGEQEQPQISETQYRYPGPKPRTREIAVVMIADAAESATRAMVEPSASRIEQLVHDLVMRRLLDGQFDDCDLTMRELEAIERTCVKMLLNIHHGRIAYPQATIEQPAPAGAAMKTALSPQSLRA